jgi:RNA polymerase sigma factor (sigma-70 family)
MPEIEVNKLVGHLFRQEAGKMAAVLTRMLGFENLDQAEDIVQDTLIKALSVWKIKGTPENPSAWLHTVAKRKAIDVLRQQKTRQHIQAEIAEAMRSEYLFVPAVNQMFMENEIEDSQLRMIFTCCHPSIPYESQIALTLKTLCGLSVTEIAKSFLTTEETITKRLYRAREKIRSENIPLEVPASAMLHSRMEAVLHTLYLLFNEGYNSSHPDMLIRRDLSEEAIRLCLLLTKNPLTNTAQPSALLALMCLQASRDDARLNSEGQIVLLKDQDRSLWNKELIDKGLSFLDIASDSEEISSYHIEAAISACHATAKTFHNTNWEEIYHLYEALYELKPAPIIEMNRAIALGYCKTPADGLRALSKIKGLESNHLYYAVLGDFYNAAKDHENAIRAFDKALSLVSSKFERELLLKKKEQLER